MTGYSFQDVTISIFDVHTAVHCVSGQESLPKQGIFTFLGNATLYNELHNSNSTLTTQSFCFKPLPKSTRKHHLWADYIQSSQDHWWLQIPLIGQLRKQLDVSLNIPSSNCTTDITVWVYLSSLGWSTNVNIRLRGYHLKTDVIELVKRLRSASHEVEMPFIWSGKKSLTDIFQYIQNIITNEIYHKNCSFIRHKEFQRQFVISINKYKGAICPFERMTYAEKGQMASLLFGEPINAKRYIEIEYSDGAYKHSKIPISGPNFAITSLKKGTLLFIQKTRYEGAIHCLHRNIQDFIMIALTRLDFIGETKSCPAESFVGSLRQNMWNNLQRLQQNYTNRFCQGYFAIHSGLKHLSRPTACE